MIRPAFDRCYALDDGPPRRPAFLSPLALTLAFVATTLLFGLLLATPFWHATKAPAGPRLENANATVAGNVGTPRPHAAVASAAVTGR